MAGLRIYVEDPTLVDAVHQAVNLWNIALGSEELSFTDDPTQAQVTIKRGQWSQGNQRGDLLPLAAASPVTGGEAKGGEIRIPSETVLRKTYGDMGIGGGLVSLIAHEIGHTLGLGHTIAGEPPGTMDPSRPGKGGPNYVEGKTGAALLRGEDISTAPSAGVVEHNQGLERRTVQDTVAGAQSAGTAEQALGLGAPPVGQHWMDLAQTFQGPHRISDTWATAALLVSAGLQARARRGANLSGFDEGDYINAVSTMAHTLRPTNRYSADEGTPRQRVVRKTPPEKVGAGGGPSNQKRQ